MARRRGEAVADLSMPEELLYRPQSEAEIARWLPADAEPPAHWRFDEATWRVVHAHGEWMAARLAWRTENDPTWWRYKYRDALDRE